MRTVEIELVRPGEPHNQLISPLVNYTGLCGHNPSVTVRVDREHREVLELLRPLQQPEGADPRARAAAIDQLTRLVQELLSPVRGIDRDLGAGGAWTELRLVLTPMELSLLPFELLATATAPGHLAQALRMPGVVLTRGLRMPEGRRPTWPRLPRILMIAASPGGLAEPPVRAHVQALVQALRPYMPRPKDGGPAPLLKVITNASVEDIAAASREQRYDWVHLLVHGGRYTDDGHDQYGLVLCGKGTANVLGGRQLVEALTPTREAGRDAPPSLVTLCTCDSGRVGSVIHPGANVAQAIHAAGVPFVVASQFPLTFAGSTIVVEEIYNQLLADVDPRAAFAATRARLVAETRAGGHPDDAAVMAMSSLDAAFESRLAEVRMLRAFELMEAAKSWLVEGATRVEEEAALKRITTAEKRLERLAGELSAERDEAIRRASTGAGPERTPHRARAAAMAAQLAELHGLLGSVAKRRADALWNRRDSTQPRETQTWYAELLRARDAYGRALSMVPDDHWAMTQWLAMSIATTRAVGAPTLEDVWERAMAAARKDVHLWGLGTRVELDLLAGRARNRPTGRACLKTAETLRAAMLPESDPYILTATARQLRQWVRWWHPQDEDGVLLAQVAAEAAEILEPTRA